MKRHPELGFTLIELMIVIALIAILAAIAFPNFREFMVQRRLNGAARQVMSDLMHARMQAVSQNNRFSVTFPSNHEYTILDDDDNDGVADGGEETQTRNIQTDDDNAYFDVTLNSTANPVIFFPRGNANGTTVTVTNSAGSKNVSVAITGRVMIN
jgi:type IV fimbrial biogenesis protein FimT